MGIRPQQRAPAVGCGAAGPPRRSLSVAIAQRPANADKATADIYSVERLLQKPLLEASQLTTLGFGDKGADASARAAALALERTALEQAAARADGGEPSTSYASLDDADGEQGGVSRWPLLLAPIAPLLDRIPRRVQGLVMLNLLVVLVATNYVIVKEAGGLRCSSSKLLSMGFIF